MIVYKLQNSQQAQDSGGAGMTLQGAHHKEAMLKEPISSCSGLIPSHSQISRTRETGNYKFSFLSLCSDFCLPKSLDPGRKISVT